MGPVLEFVLPVSVMESPNAYIFLKILGAVAMAEDGWGEHNMSRADSVMMMLWEKEFLKVNAMVFYGKLCVYLDGSDIQTDAIYIY